MKLHKPHGKNSYCGPTVISAITGISTDEVGPIVRMHNPDRGPIKGMWNPEVIRVIKELGGKAEQLPKTPGRLTLQQWMDRRSDEERERIYIAVASHHYLLIKRDLVLCSAVKGEWVNILSHPYRRKYFKGAILVEPPARPAVVPKAVSAKRRMADIERKIRARDKAVVSRLLPRLGLEVERDNPFLIVGLKDGSIYEEIFAKHGLDADTDLEEVFYSEVLGGHSMAHDWSEVREIVERVAGFVKQETGISVA